MKSSVANPEVVRLGTWPAAGIPGDATGLARSFGLADQQYGPLADGPTEAPFTAIWARAVSVPSGLAGLGHYGPGSFGGGVSYGRTIHVDQTEPGDSILLGLGEARGSAEVLVDRASLARLTLSPCQTDITAYLRPGVNDLEAIVRGTLAAYLGSASPSRAATLGRDRHGLFGRGAMLLSH